MEWRHIDSRSEPVVHGAHYQYRFGPEPVPGVVVWNSRSGFEFHPDNGDRPIPLDYQQRRNQLLVYTSIYRG